MCIFFPSEYLNVHVEVVINHNMIVYWVSPHPHTHTHTNLTSHHYKTGIFMQLRSAVNVTSVAAHAELLELHCDESLLQ